MKKMNVRLTAAAAAFMVTAGILAVPAFAAARISAPETGTMSSARARREMEGQTMNSVYLLPDSDTYYISEADVSWMDDNELMLARNEFYARRGRKFATKSIQDYFNRQGWYYGTINPDDFTSEMFNRYEQANVDFIVAYEKKRKEIRAQKQLQPAEQSAVSGAVPTGFDAGEEYSEIVDVYGSALRDNWAEEEYAIAGMNSLVSGLELPGDLGYTFRDLDGDGNGELLIGPTDPQLYGEGAVFEIYTMDGGIPVVVASSDKENVYYICEDNTIRREISVEEGHWEIDYYDLKAGDLVCKDVLVMDESLDTEDPWFAADDSDGAIAGYGDGEEVRSDDFEEDYEAISYEDASELRASYVAGSLNFTPYE